MQFDKNNFYYVISDLHGQGAIYSALMDFFDSEADKTDKTINVIINGDLIDRGPDSILMLLDVMERSHGKGKVKVELLPGNHEEMMYNALTFYRKHGTFDKSNNLTRSNLWFAADNHGRKTALDYLALPKEKQDELYDFLGSLRLYCLVRSQNNGFASYVIVHAIPPRNAMTSKYIPTLKDIVCNKDFENLNVCLTYRGNGKFNISLSDTGVITIIGHTPVESPNGYLIKENGKLLMIDGGCAYMAANPQSTFRNDMATLLVLSEVPSKVQVCLFGYGDGPLGSNLRKRGSDI